MSKRISDLFDYGDEIVVTGELLELDPEEIKELTMKKIQEENKPRRGVRVLRRTGRTLLIAAVIASLLTVTALAVGLSIHQQRQSELRDKLGIEANQVADYVEYPVPEETEDAAPGLTLLSTINNGEFQTVYVNVSPVAPEEIMDGRLMQPDSDWSGKDMPWFTANLDGQEDAARIDVAVLDWDFAEEDLGTMEEFDGTWTYPKTAAVMAKYLEQAYDAETQTLTMEIFFFDRDLKDEPMELGVKLWRVPYVDEDGGYYQRDKKEMLRDFGTVRFERVEPDKKTVWFPEPVEFVNEATGGHGRFLGAELMSQGFRWVYEYDDAEAILNAGDLANDAERMAWQELCRNWLNTIDGLESRAYLTFSDGSSFDWLGAVATDYEDGICRDVVFWETTTINVEDVVSLSIGGVTIPVK